MNNLILLAGPPCVGKTHFGRQAAKVIGGTYLDATPFLLNAWTDHGENMLGFPKSLCGCLDFNEVVVAARRSPAVCAALSKSLNDTAAPYLLDFLADIRDAVVVECSVALIGSIPRKSGKAFRVTRTVSEHVRNIIRRHHVSPTKAMELWWFYMYVDLLSEPPEHFDAEKIDATGITPTLLSAYVNN